MVSSEGWDHIVVGGGLAGCVVTSRLKEYQTSARILVIEAGPDVTQNQEILQFHSLNFIGDQFDWAYKTLPQKHFDGRQVDIPAGRALSGGSIINGCEFPPNISLFSQVADRCNVHAMQAGGFEAPVPTSTAGPTWSTTSAAATMVSCPTSRRRRSGTMTSWRTSTAATVSSTSSHLSRRTACTPWRTSPSRRGARWAASPFRGTA